MFSDVCHLIFAAAYDLSTALTELHVAIRLCDRRGTGIATRAPRKFNISSAAAMHAPLPRWGQTRSFGDVGSMSGLLESGHRYPFRIAGSGPLSFSYKTTDKRIRL